MAREGRGKKGGRKRAADDTPMPALLAAGDARGPDFLCIGAQKAGTRWLFDQLAFHPGFWMPPVKELHYLNGSKRFMKFARPLLADAERNMRSANRKRARKIERPLAADDLDCLRARIWLHGRKQDLDLYARLFNPRGNRLSGDICPPYAIIPQDEARAVRDRFPEARIVYLIRDPVERFWSQYCMILRRHPREAPESLASVQAFMEKGTGLEHSAIRSVIERWRLGPEDGRFALHFFDELRSDAAGLRRRIVTFLGGDPDLPSGDLPANHNRKASYAKIPMSDEVRDYLAAEFAAEIRYAAAELGGPAEAWPAKYGL
jgi:hypothetical protein